MRHDLRVTALSWLALVLCTAAFVSAADDQPSASPDAAKPYTQKIPGSDVSFEMVPVPGGEFLLGSPDAEAGRLEDEGPRVKVKVEPFFMGKFEVTQAEFDLFRKRYRDISYPPQEIPEDRRADAVTYPTPMYELELGPQLERMGRGGRFPAVFMSYYAARQYAKWISKKTGRFYRLPTEAEWEYACRAGTTTAFSFGDDPKQLDEYGWYFDNSKVKVVDEVGYREVGTKKPNPWGLYDMHGNVAELVIGQYEKTLYEDFAGRAGAVNAEEVVMSPKKEYPRMARGGSFYADPIECRSAARGKLGPEVNGADPVLPRSRHWYASGPWIGFRLVAPATPPDAETQARYWDELDESGKKYFNEMGDRQVRELIEPPDAKK